eukprot:TRINITY_DN2814_c0_g1_i8.p3 TRINITY_DN2814_c0_g1~~TRINITY_DN2814_c0_g1_i8.p3  ORF type:complete len:147 (-),score=5.86 TRINITY_DN2814_c0_g1_i8:311-751(-)
MNCNICIQKINDGITKSIQRTSSNVITFIIIKSFFFFLKKSKPNGSEGLIGEFITLVSTVVFTCDLRDYIGILQCLLKKPLNCMVMADKDYASNQLNRYIINQSLYFQLKWQFIYSYNLWLDLIANYVEVNFSKAGSIRQIGKLLR